MESNSPAATALEPVRKGHLDLLVPKGRSAKLDPQARPVQPVRKVRLDSPALMDRKDQSEPLDRKVRQD